MERENKYHSTSVLGQIYDTIQSSQTENLSTDGESSSLSIAFKLCFGACNLCSKFGPKKKRKKVIETLK